MGRERTHGEADTVEYTVEDVLDVFTDVSVPILTAPEVATELGCSDPTARARLDELAEDGRLYRKNAGARAVVYAFLDGLDTHPSDTSQRPGPPPGRR